MRSSSYFKVISRILILAMLHLCWLTSYGYAEMVPTESANPSQYQDDRQRILDLLDRQEVANELEKYSISKVEASARINSLTDEEVTEIAANLGELPAGGAQRVCRTNEGYGPCESSFDGGAVLAVIGILVLLFVLIFYWLRGKNKVDSPTSKKGTYSEPVVEEDCDPGFESCL